jgi:hypothetical protein
MKIIRTISLALFAAALAMPAGTHAQATVKTKAKSAHAQAKDETKWVTKATARCTDNTWSMAASEQGACSSHGGVAKWFGKRPRGTTARCTDGEYWMAAERQGACSGHGGVVAWYKKPKGK